MSLIDSVIFYILHPLVTVIIWIVIINAVLSWLVAFNIINYNNDFVRMVANFTNAVTEPLLRPFRSVIPPLGGVDISPMILIILLIFVQRGFLPWLARVLP